LITCQCGIFFTTFENLVKTLSPLHFHVLCLLCVGRCRSGSGSGSGSGLRFDHKVVQLVRRRVFLSRRNDNIIGLLGFPFSRLDSFALLATHGLNDVVLNDTMWMFRRGWKNVLLLCVCSSQRGKTRKRSALSGCKAKAVVDLG